MSILESLKAEGREIWYRLTLPFVAPSIGQIEQAKRLNDRLRLQEAATQLARRAKANLDAFETGFRKGYTAGFESGVDESAKVLTEILDRVIEEADAEERARRTSEAVRNFRLAVEASRN